MPLDLPPLPELPKDDSNIDFKPDYLYGSREEIIEDLKQGKRVFGKPGAALSWGVDGNNEGIVRVGIEGEEKTAEVLHALSQRYNKMFVFHSTSWPNTKADTDHVVVFGNTVIIIDSKKWKSVRRYNVTANGDIMRGTVPFEEGKTTIKYQMASWREKLASYRVIGVVSIAQEKVAVIRDRNWYRAPYRLVENEKLADFLEQVFKDNPVMTPTKLDLLVNIASIVVKPRDRRRELIQVDSIKI